MVDTGVYLDYRPNWAAAAVRWIDSALQMKAEEFALLLPVPAPIRVEFDAPGVSSGAAKRPCLRTVVPV